MEFDMKILGTMGEVACGPRMNMGPIAGNLALLADMTIGSPVLEGLVVYSVIAAGSVQVFSAIMMKAFDDINIGPQGPGAAIGEDFAKAPVASPTKDKPVAPSLGQSPKP